MFTLKLSLAIFLLSLGAPGLTACRKSDRKESDVDRQHAQKATSAPLVLGSDELRAIGDFARAGLAGKPLEIPAALRTKTRGVYIAARFQGRRLAETWGHGASVGAAMLEALRALPPHSAADTLEVFIDLEEQELDGRRDRRRLRSNIHRGIFGLAIGSGPEREMFSPTYALASNRKNARLIELYGREHGLTEDEQAGLAYAFLVGPQLLIPLRDAAPARLMERGNRLVDLAEVTTEGVELFLEAMSKWMWHNLDANGQMTYLYYPSQGEVAGGRDNLIRQFMASIALGRLATRSGNQELAARAAKNIDRNLHSYYAQEGKLGVVELRGKVKLGALALAALAIVEHPDRQRWASQEAALRASVQSLWQEDGSFRTFLRPEGRTDNQNFYPGEALLLWASLYAQDHDPALLAQLMTSFRFYRKWHMDQAEANRRNPAFVPWHTQAYFMLWRQTNDAELAAFIFEMNDWLLDVQEWDEALYPDTRGRFHDPTRPFGPPHASSTGVYLEGLVDAYQLARALGDEARARRYQLSIKRGLRSSMQLQFADDIDMFYVHDKEAVRGGLRTTVYDNQIRCDNVQHTLMATLKILDSDALADPLPARH